VTSALTVYTLPLFYTLFLWLKRLYGSAETVQPELVPAADRDVSMQYGA
jgi:hypothetical protein